MLCTSCFVDDVIFSCHGASGPESSMLCLEVRKVVVLAGLENSYSVWLSLSECGSGCELFCLRLTCKLLHIKLMANVNEKRTKLLQIK